MKKLISLVLTVVLLMNVLPLGGIASAESVQPKTWKILLLIFKQTDTDYIDTDGSGQHLKTSIDQSNADALINAFTNKVIPAVYEWSGQYAKWDVDVAYSTEPITRVSEDGQGDHSQWVAPTDIAFVLDKYAPSGRYDNVFVYWKNKDGTKEIPQWYGGLSLTIANESTNYAGYSTVPWNPDLYWANNTMSENDQIWIHEWLHPVSSYFRDKGFNIPDLHSAVDHGYYPGTNTLPGWEAWYRDYMTGQVDENGKLVGINANAWAYGTIRQDAPITPTTTIVNPGFENDLTGWDREPSQFQYGSPAETDSIVAHTGTKSAKLYLRYGGSELGQDIDVNIPANTPIILKLWARMPFAGSHNTKWFNPYIRAFSASGQLVAQNTINQFDPLPNWTQLQITLTPNQSVAKIRIGAMTQNGDGGYFGFDHPVWVDDFEVFFDKTAPEASIQFDPAIKDISVTGVDNLGGPVVVSHTETNDRYGRKARTYTLIDQAGNITNLDLRIKSEDRGLGIEGLGLTTPVSQFIKPILSLEGYGIKAEVLGLKYNGADQIVPAKNSLEFKWPSKKEGSLKELEQSIKVKNQFHIKGKYEAEKDQTTIHIKQNNQTEQKLIKPGLVLLNLNTNNGVFEFSY